MKRKFTKGEVYQASVSILKIKKGQPTVIKVNGEEYVLRHKDQFRGRKQK